jgi:hypothetical protein
MTPLASLSADAAPDFVDPPSCKAWLAHLPLANVAAAQQAMLAQLAQFARLPTTPANRLAVLEALREALHFVQLEQAKRFAYRALPLGESESAAFELTSRLWDEMRAGYQRCQQAAAEGDAAARAHAALASQRLVACCGLKMLAHYRACHEVPGQDWSALHQAYARAEQLEVAEEPVKDFLSREASESSPRISYARALLVGLANPNQLAQRQLSFVSFLLERWAAKLEISSRPLDDAPAPLIVDLGGESCAQRMAGEGSLPASVRYLGTRALSKSLRGRVDLLRKGESPAKLGLGEDCVQPGCEQLLVHLYRQWCEPRPGRGVERRRVSQSAAVCAGIAAVHACLAGAGTPEAWEVADDSAAGLRLVRGTAHSGERYAHGQLLAVRPADAHGYMLGQLRWLMRTHAGALHAGVKLLPGTPTAIAVRATGLNAQDDGYVPALALSGVPALGAPAALVLPAGWFKPRRVIDRLDGDSRRVRLTELLERGLDFERVAYEPLD